MSSPTTHARTTPDPAGTLALSKPIRLRIPSLEIDAPIAIFGVNHDGVMDTPQSPDLVAWYDFSALPGDNGNAVFSGHRDWHTGVTAVFWRLGELNPGNIIYVGTTNGELRYTVISTDLYDQDQAPISKIVGNTSFPAITLITCEGDFVSSDRNYSHRRVVRATLS